MTVRKLFPIIIFALIASPASADFSFCKTGLSSALDALIRGRSTPQLPPDIGSVVTRDLIKTVKKITTRLIKTHDPEKSFFVGIGRSPTLFTADLKARGIRDVVNLPLSGFRPNRPDTILQLTKKLTDADVKNLFEHFERFLPTESELAGKHLVLMDFASTGDTITAAADYIRRFYKAKEANVTVDAIAFVSPVKIKNFYLPNEVDQVQIKDKALLKLFKDHGLDRLAEYGRFDIKSADRTIESPNPSYEELVRAFHVKAKAW